MRAVADQQVFTQRGCFATLSCSISPRSACGLITTPVAMTTSDGGEKRPDGKQRQLVRLPVEDDGVARVVPPLVAHDDVVPVGEQIDDFALGFIAPLKPDNSR